MDRTIAAGKLSGRRRRSCCALSPGGVPLSGRALRSSTIPLAVLYGAARICGAVLAATMRGLANDVYFTVGLVTIIGLAAKDAILIISNT